LDWNNHNCIGQFHPKLISKLHTLCITQLGKYEILVNNDYLGMELR
jgi:hypothetical protein